MLICAVALAGCTTHSEKLRPAGTVTDAPLPHAPENHNFPMNTRDSEARLAENRRIVTHFYELVFTEHKPHEAVALYLTDKYIQHHPDVQDGPKAFIDFCEAYFKKFPEVRAYIKRTVAEGDLVCVHSESRRGPTDRGRAIMDIFRLERGKIVEHWDVMQDLPETNTNRNGMF